MEHKRPLAEKYKVAIFGLLACAFLCYTAYLYLFLPAKQDQASATAANGKMVWQRYNCNACHQVYGLGGFLGPDLTNVYGKKGPEYIKAFLTIGTPSMPQFHLNEKETNELLAYLANIDSSGVSDPRTFSIKMNGSIEQNK